jgi:hypothetical protein
VIPCAAAVSRVRKLLIWPIALIIGAGNITVVFLLHPELGQRLQVPQSQGASGGHHRARRIPKGGRGHRFALGGNKFGTLCPARPRLAGPSRVSYCRAIGYPSARRGSLPAPLEGRHIEDLLDVGVNDVDFGERLVQGVLSDHLAQRRLGDLS